MSGWRSARCPAWSPTRVRFCFDLVTEGTNLEGAALEINQPPAMCQLPGLRQRLRARQPDRAVPLRQRRGHGADRPGPARSRRSRWHRCARHAAAPATWRSGCMPSRPAAPAAAAPAHPPRALTHSTATADHRSRAHSRTTDAGPRRSRSDVPDRLPAAAGPSSCSRRCWPRTTSSPSATGEWLRARGVLAVEPDELARRGQDHAAGAHRRDLAGRMTHLRHRGRPGDGAGRARGSRPPGCRVVQINTGAGCHLDAEMVARGAAQRWTRRAARRGRSRTSATWSARPCSTSASRPGWCSPSVTEGADKPLKYPHMFRQADLVLLNKTDLLPYVDFDLKRYAADLRRVSPDALLLQLSATTGDGMQAWYDWLRRRIPAAARVVTCACSWAQRPCSPRSASPVAGGRHRGLAEADPAVVARHPRVRQHPEARSSSRADDPPSSSRFWNTPPDSATVPSPVRSRSGRTGRHDRGRDPVVEPGRDDRRRDPAARSSAAARTRSAPADPQLGRPPVDRGRVAADARPGSASCSSSTAAWPS